MMFGDPRSFAIEVDLFRDPAGVWMNGRACYWISGGRVGDFEMFDSLRDVLFCWERMSYDRDRFSQDLSRLDTQPLIATLECSLYNVDCPDQKALQRRAIDGTWARHNINPGTISFSGWSIFLVETGRAARCLYAPFANLRVCGREQLLRLGEFNQVLDAAIAYLLGEYQRFGGH